MLEWWLGCSALVPDVAVPDFAAVLRRMGLGEVVSEIVGAGSPSNGVLAAFHPIADPMISHVDRLGALETDGIIGETNGGGVVRDDWSGRLWVPEVCEGET